MAAPSWLPPFPGFLFRAADERRSVCRVPPRYRKAASRTAARHDAGKDRREVEGMTMRRCKLAAAALGALARAACSGGPARVKNGPAPPAATSANDVDAAFDLLMQGDEAGAKKRLKAVQKRDPMNPGAQLLNESIARDPKELLGPQSYPYVVRSGDTVVGLAERFLGNRMKAYQLLRYNGLDSRHLDAR